MKVIVKRSARRKKTIPARMVDGAMVVMAPATISDEELDEHISRFRAKMEMKIAPKDNVHLQKRADYLNRRYFDGALSWKSISYSYRQMKRRGSCTPADGTIRISSRMKNVPQWVEDYIIVHELAHLVEPNHGKRFKNLVHKYPLSERATGYLMALDAMGYKD